MKLNEDAHGDVKVVCSFSKESSIFNSLSVDGMNLEIRMCFRYSNTITFYDNFFFCFQIITMFKTRSSQYLASISSLSRKRSKVRQRG